MDVARNTLTNCICRQSEVQKLEILSFTLQYRLYGSWRLGPESIQRRNCGHVTLQTTRQNQRKDSPEGNQRDLINFFSFQMARSVRHRGVGRRAASDADRRGEVERGRVRERAEVPESTALTGLSRPPGLFDRRIPYT